MFKRYSYHTFNAEERKERRGGGLLAPEMVAVLAGKSRL